MSFFVLSVTCASVNLISASYVKNAVVYCVSPSGAKCLGHYDIIKVDITPASWAVKRQFTHERQANK